MTARGIVVGLLDRLAAICAAAIARWPALERPFVTAGCAAAGTTAGRAFYRPGSSRRSRATVLPSG